MSAADPAGALADYLKTTSVGSITSNRVYRPKLATAIVASMPTEAVVIQRAGGYGLFGRRKMPVGDPRLDIFCYGTTDLSAGSLAAEVVLALKALRTSTHRGTRLMWANIEGGPLPVLDPETNWPCEVLSAQVAHCETAVA